MKNNKGFTLIELVIVIVILGILAAVAIPKFTDLTDEAKISSEQGTVGAVRSGIGIVHGTLIVKYANIDTNDDAKVQDVLRATTGNQNIVEQFDDDRDGWLDILEEADTDGAATEGIFELVLDQTLTYDTDKWQRYSEGYDNVADTDSVYSGPASDDNSGITAVAGDRVPQATERWNYVEQDIEANRSDNPDNSVTNPNANGLKDGTFLLID